ncbi:hypothetical protein Golob_007375 [Gossypium lobatum]|uniref:RNase H type-1 domain-containing protein n=1 Tax=Gossypium lobatum TaxID=34289 RepID=A0A7J8MCK2_9ROSI|nr:hypothetical protein [Gossypium lobatum]
MIPGHMYLDLGSALSDMVLGVPPPHLAAGTNRIIWGGTSTGFFSIKSAYGKLRESSWKLKEGVWRFLGKFQRPQRVRFFIWLEHSSVCGVCGDISEDILHAIRDCNAATGSPQTCRIVIIFVLVRLIGNVSLGLLFGLSGRIVISSYSKILPSCTRLVGNWACLYTNGSVIYESDSAAAGETVRNRNGKWIFGFNRFLGSYSVFEAELWGILDDLSILIKWGYDHVIIQTNSLEAATIFQKRPTKRPNSALIKRIFQLLT